MDTVKERASPARLHLVFSTMPTLSMVRRAETNDWLFITCCPFIGLFTLAVACTVNQLARRGIVGQRDGQVIEG
jgi:hypothetical protein